MSRFAETFARLRAEDDCGLFPYLTAGFPNVETSQALADAALAAGADGFEIGVPFSDPMADGATLQRANAVALEGGATLDTAFDLARYIRSKAPRTPIALMSYYNPVLARGEAQFAQDLAAAGGDGAIVPDLAVEESSSLRAALDGESLDLVSMLAPTSPDERVRRIGALARGFVYCVALVGVTGARQSLSDALGDFLGRVRAATDAPLVVGFGISRPEHVRRVAELGGDGVIVASALADLVEHSPEPVADAGRYLSELKAATSRESPVTSHQL